MSIQASFYDMRTVFELQLGSPLLENLATIGCFDGRTPSLVCATNTNRLIMHTPDAPNAPAAHGSTVRTLNFGRQPTALAAGRLRDTAGRAGVDALYFGSASSLLAYDVERNNQLFYKSIEDGVHAVVCGVVNTAKGSGGAPAPLAIVGGNCAVNGFDESGAEELWTVTGDHVSAVALVPWADGDGAADAPSAIVAASEDFELRIFDGEELVGAVMEAERVSHLAASGAPGRFAYIAASGTVGVYDRTSRVWRARGRDRPVSAAFCDVDGDGVAELVVGWASGRVEVRGDDAARRGALYRAALSAPVAAVLAHDYRQTGRALPLFVTADGAVRGMELAGRGTVSGAAAAARGRGAFALAALQRERQALAAELARLEEQLRRQRAGATDATLPGAGTRVTARVAPNPQTGRLDIELALAAAPPDAVIQSCVLRSEAAVPGREFALFAAEEPAATLVCPVAAPRAGAATRVLAAVVVGATNAECYQVQDMTVEIPACAMCRVGTPTRAPAGFAVLHIRADATAIAGVTQWLAQTFALQREPSDTNGGMVVELVDVRDGSGLAVETDAARGVITVRADTMEACGDVIESLGTALRVDAAASCDFPNEIRELTEVLERVGALNATRLTLSSNMADVALTLKPLLVRAEDSRLLGDMETMRRFYAQLYDLNRELMDENLKRFNNYTELKAALKKVNGFIMKAARLRLGKMRAKLIADCREAVQQNNTKTLVNLIRNGQR